MYEISLKFSKFSLNLPENILRLTWWFYVDFDSLGLQNLPFHFIRIISKLTDRILALLQFIKSVIKVFWG